MKTVSFPVGLIPRIAGALTLIALLSAPVLTQLKASATDGDAGIQAGYIDTHNHLPGGPDPNAPCVFDAGHLLDPMDTYGIQKTLLMPVPYGAWHLEQVLCPPSAYASVVSAYPERFAFLEGGEVLSPLIRQAVITGQLTQDTLRRFEETAAEIVRAGAVGFGEFAAEHFSFHAEHPYETAPPDHPLFLRLADIAARHDMPIDFHMEAVARDIPFAEISPCSRAHQSPLNPPMLTENITAFERLLRHNRNARIVWAHAGWDNTGHRTVGLMRRLLQDHPNLYMQVKPVPPPPPDGCPMPNQVLGPGGQIGPEWLDLIRSFPDRFTVGLDTGAERMIMPARYLYIANFLGQLPTGLRRKLGQQNAIDLYRLELAAVVDARPDTLNLRSRGEGNAVTAYVELPAGHDVSRTLVPTVKLEVNGVSVPAQASPTEVGDYDGDGVADVMVKFDRGQVVAALAGKTGNIAFNVSGLLANGRWFVGSDFVRVVNP